MGDLKSRTTARLALLATILSTGCRTGSDKAATARRDEDRNNNFLAPFVGGGSRNRSETAHTGVATTGPRGYDGNGIDSTFNNAMSVIRGDFDKYPGIGNYKEAHKSIIEYASSTAYPLKVLYKKQFVDAPINLTGVKFCEGGKYDRVAKLFNSFKSREDRNAAFSGLTACIASKESADYWTRTRRLLKQLWPDRREKGSGVLGVFSLDASSREGNQSLCLGQFKRWQLAEELGVGNAAPGPQYAKASDQRFNISCGSYFAISAWIASQMRNKGQCADVVPRYDTQYGSLDNNRYAYCVQAMGNPQNIVAIRESLYKKDEGLFDSKRFLVGGDRATKHNNGI